MTYPNDPGRGRHADPYGQPYPPQQQNPSYPNQQHPAQQHWPPPPTAPKKPKWPWIVGGVLAFIVIASMFSNTGTTPAPVAGPSLTPVSSAPAAPASTIAAPTTTAAPVVDVVLPEVKGRNGGIVYDELIKLGLTNLRLASRDKADTVVVLPSNWTAVKIEPKAGSTVRSDQTVVVTMTKN